VGGIPTSFQLAEINTNSLEISNMKNTSIVVSAVIVAFAANNLQATETEKLACNPTNYTELVRCLEKSSSEIKISDQQLKSASKLEEAASEWINPDLDVEHVRKGSEKSETTASLLFTLRLGGKRDALITEAKSEFEKALAERSLNLSQYRLDIILSLYRLSHLKSEIKFEEESVSTFTKIVRQFENRAALSPEQDVSLSVFKMAQDDHQLRLAKLKSEEDKILQILTATTAISKEAILKNLPGKKDRWPEVVQSYQSNSSPQYKKAEADLNLARSLKNKADSEAWPDLKIGPSVRTTKEEQGSSETFYGAALSIPIPAFSQNSGARAYQAQKVIEADLIFDKAKRNLESQRKSLEERYKKTVHSLKNTIRSSVLSERHEKVEKQFFKGLVSSSLVIEAHRQLFELEERRNSTELEAIEAYGQLLILNNQFEEAAL
jgi:outer membrane protein, heavy metal efflux system